MVPPRMVPPLEMATTPLSVAVAVRALAPFNTISVVLLSTVLVTATPEAMARLAPELKVTPPVFAMLNTSSVPPLNTVVPLAVAVPERINVPPVEILALLSRPPFRMVSMPPSEIVVPEATAPLETINEPALLTVVALTLPPELTLCVPPDRVALVMMPPDRIISVPPARTVSPALVPETFDVWPLLIMMPMRPPHPRQTSPRRRAHRDPIPAPPREQKTHTVCEAIVQKRGFSIGRTALLRG